MPEKAERDVAVNTVAPVWDGNETWLVLGGGGLLAVFPLAYAVVLPALYMPLILMLLALDVPRRRLRDALPGGERDPAALVGPGLLLGAMVAAFMQGIALGAFVQGIEVNGRSYAGGWWDWLTPFSVLTGAGADGGLRAARRLLAAVEDGGAAARARRGPRLALRAGDGGGHRARLGHHALPAAGLRRALADLPEPAPRRAGARAGGLPHLALLPRAGRGHGAWRDGGRAALPARARALRAVLCRARRVDVADDRAAGVQHLGGGGAAGPRRGSCWWARRC